MMLISLAWELLWLAHIHVVVEQPWETQGEESSVLDLKAHPSDSSEPISGVQTDSTNQATESKSDEHGELLLAATGSEAPADDDAASPD